ncbi:MAG TPA: DUF2786 domain-containing protein [Acidimicrobiales bacterium]|nr:DUF2786 domain-containing protein [Acidimicrobiales bacterium]
MAYRRGDTEAYAKVLGRLGIGPGVGHGAAHTAQVLDVLVERAIGEAWRHGWQPADVERVVRRRLGADHAVAAVAAIASEHRRYAAVTVSPAWRAQLRAMGAEPWRSGPGEPPGGAAFPGSRLAGIAGRWLAELRRRLEVLSVLLVLPVLPRLGPLPGEATATGSAGLGTEVDGRVLERVRALLAKAESSSFAEEAEAFTAKAQELMARHALDRAMLDDAAGACGPGGRRIGTDDPYAQSKALLLDEVATANRCRTAWSAALGFSTVFGHERDIDGVEILYTSLLVQASRAIAAAGAQTDRRGRLTTRSFRTSFYVAYATRIGQRLRQSSAAAEAAGTDAHGAGLLPVLVARDRAVDEAFQETFPTMKRSSVSATNGAGWVAGTTAADQARLNPSPEVEPPAG